MDQRQFEALRTLILDNKVEMKRLEVQIKALEKRNQERFEFLRDLLMELSPDAAEIPDIELADIPDDLKKFFPES